VNVVLLTIPRILIRRRLANVGVLAAAGVLAAVFSILALNSASMVSAQVAEIRIAELQCNSNPESVTITNQGGGAGQDLTGWTLKSDPVASESFDLSVIGVLGAGVSVFVEAGPSAQGSYVWSTEFVLRDSDATDFARIVNANGAVVHEVKCQSASPTPAVSGTAQPTPTVAPTAARPAPTAAPATAPSNVVPDGGGPPGNGSWQSGGLMLVVGVWLLAAVFGVVVLGRLRSDRAQPVIVSATESLLPAIHSGSATLGKSRWLYLVLVLVLAAIATWSSGSDERHPRR
jgi:hypothetical protein